jgi:hypothetical protein
MLKPASGELMDWLDRRIVRRLATEAVTAATGDRPLWTRKCRLLLTGRTIVEVERAAGWPPGRLSWSLSTGARPRIERGLALAAALGVAPDYVFDDTVPIEDVAKYVDLTVRGDPARER